MAVKDDLISLNQYIKNKKLCNELKHYKDIHKGERCFIIGTGPSLTANDLERLKGEVTFGTNRIFEIFSQTDWRPTYYMNQDYQLICKYVDEIKELKVRRKFLPLDTKKYFQEKKDISYFLLRHKDFYPGDADFSRRLDIYLGQGFTVTYGAIQMAYYMGFAEVYLLGIDHNYSISLDEKGVPVLQNNVKDYFQGSKANNEGLNLPRIVESTMAYLTAKKFADSKSGFSIYNATRGGKLEVFKRIDFDTIFQQREKHYD